jgi:hypothetical protein
MLAGLYHIFGTGAKGAYSVEFAEALVLSGEIVLIPFVAQALGVDLVTGFIAAVLAIFGMRRNYVAEANYVGFLLLLSTLLACRYLSSLDACVLSGVLMLAFLKS